MQICGAVRKVCHVALAASDWIGDCGTKLGIDSKPVLKLEELWARFSASSSEAQAPDAVACSPLRAL